MKESIGNIWDNHFWTSKEYSNWIVIPTNGNINSSGNAVMGRGLAKEAKERFPLLPKKLGGAMAQRGNLNVHSFSFERIVAFPTKEEFFQHSKVTLIKQNLQQLEKMFANYDGHIHLPRLGCGQGRLDWLTEVRPLLLHLDDRYIVWSLS